MNDALGLVEIKGLAGAIAVADAMVKTANVGLIGIEKAKGFGWITIKISGDVGAVTASVQTGRALAEQNGQLVSYKVIPRPAQSIGELFCKTIQETPPDDPEPSSSLQPEILPELDSQLKPIDKLAESESAVIQHNERLPQEDKLPLQQELTIQSNSEIFEEDKLVHKLNPDLNEEIIAQAEEQKVEEKESGLSLKTRTPAKKGRPAKSPGRSSKSKKRQEDANSLNPEEGSR